MAGRLPSAVDARQPHRSDPRRLFFAIQPGARVLRSDVLSTLIQSHPLGLLEGFKRAVELQKNKDLGPLAKLKTDYLGKIGPQPEDRDIGLNAVNCISLYNTVCNRLRGLADGTPGNGALSERAQRNLIRAIEALCTRLEIGLEDIVGWNRAAAPWDRIGPRETVFVATCERPYQRLDSHQNLAASTAFSVPDTYVYVHLHTFFASLPSKPTVHHVGVPHGVTPEAAQQQLSALLAEEPAVIVTIGSAHGNPLTGACLRRAFGDLGRRNFPARFVWRWPSDHLIESMDTLVGDEFSHPGIWVAPDRYLRRSCDPDGLPDAGVLAVDAREETVVCCLAGHGGLGTLATASALLDTSRIAEAITQSTGDLHQRLLAVVEVSGEPAGRPKRNGRRRAGSPYDDDWLPGDLFWHTKRPVWWRYVLG
jgi:hypothetical protein